MTTYAYVPAAFDYGPRKGPVLAFVIHMAEGGGTVGYLAGSPARGVSVHYVVERSGRVVRMLSEDHASGSIDPTRIRTTDDRTGPFGRTAALEVLGSWADDPNAAAISVELEGFATTGPNDEQDVALAQLVADVRERHPGIGLLGHRDFADYKACPGARIDWPTLGGHGRNSQVYDIDVSSSTAQLVDVPAGTRVLNLDGSSRLTAPAARTGVLSPFASTSAGGTRLRAIVWTEADPTPDLLLAVYATAVVNVRAVDPVVDCDDAVALELELAASRAAAAVRARA